MTPDAPRTEAGKRDHDDAWHVEQGETHWGATHRSDREGCPGCAWIAAIEAEAATPADSPREASVDMAATALQETGYLPVFRGGEQAAFAALRALGITEFTITVAPADSLDALLDFIENGIGWIESGEPNHWSGMNTAYHDRLYELADAARALRAGQRSPRNDEPEHVTETPGCGSLDWTVEQFGRVTHKHSCPNRTDPFCQTHPLGCPPESGSSKPPEPHIDHDAEFADDVWERKGRGSSRPPDACTACGNPPDALEHVHPRYGHTFRGSSKPGAKKS